MITLFENQRYRKGCPLSWQKFLCRIEIKYLDESEILISEKIEEDFGIILRHSDDSQWSAYFVNEDAKAYYDLFTSGYDPRDEGIN